MAPTKAQHEIAAFIEKEVNQYPDTGRGTEQLLVNMYKPM